MRQYFRDIYLTVKTILIGLRITLKYCFASTITVQYPDVRPVLQPRFRGFHSFEIHDCIACDLCAKACPVDCIYIEADGRGKNAHLTRYAIDYQKCMFCALCVPPCPTECIHMGNVHDMSAFDRESMIVEFTDLARQGLQTPQPLWMQKEKLPGWVEETKQQWIDKGQGESEEMNEALKPVSQRKKPPTKKDAKPKASKT
jgi:NADH-quinone oxidoreductase subunit I